MTKPSDFIAPYVVVVLGTLFFVMTLAFILVPYALQGHPGELGNATAVSGTVRAAS